MKKKATTWMTGCLLLSGFTTGCTTMYRDKVPPPNAVLRPSVTHVRQVQFVPPNSAAVPPESPVTESQQPAFVGLSELSVDGLVEQVLARNPTVAQMVAAWQAASAKPQQVSSLDDPMFGATIAPASIGSNNLDFGGRLEISQRYPFPGKLDLRGANAQAEAQAAGDDVQDTRLQLTEAAKSAFYDYYLVYRALTVNEESLRLLNDFRKNAETLYKTGKAEQQDVLQADVDIGKQRERGVILERYRQVAIARLNTLMHRRPDLALPPPPKDLKVDEALPDVSILRANAVLRRPDVAALRNHIAAEEASLGLAHREFCPDFEVMAAYDSIMGNGSGRDLAPQLAVRVNLPVRTTRRFGAVAEAEARIAGRHAELARLTDQINYDVQQAFEQVRESERVVRLYEKEVLPAARNNVKAAQSSYTTGKIPFLSLIEAQRNVVMLQDRYYEAIADYFRRLATLERAAGGTLNARPGAGRPVSPPAEQCDTE